ncbi:hypothetical protein HPB49_013945 [Dermacentor silvarum]|uniref:Uncharacterized protein n=1 Tax=Dermacentor silvarum TaxID=543639 RepID=A0ACB8C9W2_DERSI|nr:hypothetical protein HPB49_013945 [Dermacentor silvarum]
MPLPGHQRTADINCLINDLLRSGDARDAVSFDGRPSLSNRTGSPGTRLLRDPPAYTTVATASLATAVALQTPSAGTIDTAVEPSTTPTSSSDVQVTGDCAAVPGSLGVSPLEPHELGSDDEGASRKLQAVGTAPHIASTTKLPPRVQTIAPSPRIVAVPPRASFSTSCQRRRNAAIILRPSLPSLLPHDLQPPVVHLLLLLLLPWLPLLRPGLFRPAHNGAAFPRTCRLAMAQALSALTGVKAIRMNTKNTIVAADAPSQEWTEHLLATSEIAGMPVTACHRADRTQSSGVVPGVHGNYAHEDLLAVISIYLFSMPFEMRPYRPRPLQRLCCGCYGHATATCRRPVRCLRCGGPHQMESCCSSRVSCLHCGGPHPSDSPDCQLWQRGRCLVTIKASASTHLSHREAQAVLWTAPTSSAAAASGPPHVRPAGGKTYSAALGAPDKEVTTSTNHPQPRLQQCVQQACAKKWGSIKPGPSPKEAPQSTNDKQNKNPRLLLRAIADLRPPDNQQLRVQPVPDIENLQLQAARRRAERIALAHLSTGTLDSVPPCRRRLQASSSVTPKSELAGRLLFHQPLSQRTISLAPPDVTPVGARAHRQVLFVAVHMGISAGNLAELLADLFVATPPALQAPPPEAAARSIPSSCHHAYWVAA